MKEAVHRPHLAVDGRLCDEDQPCVHVRVPKERGEGFALLGSLIGCVLGAVAAALSFDGIWDAVGLGGIAAVALAALCVGSWCFRRRL